MVFSFYYIGRSNEITIEHKEDDNDFVASLNNILTDDMSDFDESESFDKQIKTFMRRYDLKGASLAIMKDDKLIYAKGYGYANDTLECSVKNVFRVASVSKLVTATAIMKLHEQGKINLDDKVFGENGILNDSIYLNIEDKRLRDITVEHLLRHKAAFRSPHGDPMFNAKSVARSLNKPLPLQSEDYVVYASHLKLFAQPGKTSRYSNLGYVVLSKVIEKVSGIGYEDFVKDSILAPISCYDMHIGRNFDKYRRPNEVSYNEVAQAQEVEAFDGTEELVQKSNGGNDVNALQGAGGWVASPVELLKLVAAIDGENFREDILSAASVRKMTELQKNSIPIGWARVSSNEWFRSGNMAGSSALIKKQKDGYIWAFVTNSSTWRGPRFYKDISANVSKAIDRVKHWPNRDLFDVLPTKIHSSSDK